MGYQANKQKKWNLLYSPLTAEDTEQIIKLSSDLDITRVMARLLYSRGYRDASAVRSFLSQEEAFFHDAYLMQDMERAVARISKALEQTERIAIYGDYDVDGVTSVSLLYLYLKAHGADVGYYIPNRHREGYGLSAGAIDHLHQKGVTLIITVDTGITATEEVAYAASLGIDVVVTDHHECREELPIACAVVNPHRPDDAYPFKELAGVGVIFKVICAYEMAECRKRGENELDGIRRVCKEYIDLVAIGTISDVMPLVDENRLIVTYGLSLLENTERCGLRALIAEISQGNGRPAQKRKVNSSFISFAVAPRMNAAGRVGEASDAVELLLAEDEATAKCLAEKLCELNLQRQVEENRIAEQAYRKIEETMSEENSHVIVIEDDGWMQGIIGIVSSRITEKYGLPSILISFDGATRGFAAPDDIGKGSGRSIKGMNLVEALTDSEELLVRFGGHELAAGLSLRRCNIDAFRNRINRYAKEHLSERDLCLSADVDLPVEMEDLTMRFAQELLMLEPFGVRNAVPNLLLEGARITRILPMGNGKHTKLLIEKDGRAMTAVWFHANPVQLPFEIGDTVDVLFQLNVNEFQGTVSLQMLVQDIHLSNHFLEDYLAQKARYEQIRAGKSYTEEENVLPSRDDIAVVYSMLRREFRAGHTVFPMRRILGMLDGASNTRMNYIKVKFILRIMQELKICDVTETAEDVYLFEFYFQQTKTNLEKSTILHRLRTQVKRSREE
ncbi:MAG: single-stranded-DNA-specific exonuclease RecJ [Clostridia bacterium]|nr:single-stranded-DNA-specific exonuclease RecJ [Clostridia bacterium]